jgi:hypothetical protein
MPSGFRPRHVVVRDQTIADRVRETVAIAQEMVRCREAGKAIALPIRHYFCRRIDEAGERPWAGQGLGGG